MPEGDVGCLLMVGEGFGFLIFFGGGEAAVVGAGGFGIAIRSRP